MFLRHDPWENSNEDIPVAVAIAARVDEELAAVGLVVKVEGRAIVVDGIPVDNAAPNEAGFKLLKAEDIKNDEKIKIVGGVPTDATDESSAGFRLPKVGGEQPRIIEVLIAEEEDDLTPGFRNGNAAQFCQKLPKK